MGFFDGINDPNKDFKGIGRKNDGGDFMAVPVEPDNETTPKEAEIIAINNEIAEIDNELEQIRLMPFLSKEDEEKRSVLEKRREELLAQRAQTDIS